MKKITLLILTQTICLNMLLAQRANNWKFGNGAGLSFTATPPSPLSNGQTIAPDNTSAISDINGNLLFYTNGVNVWNKNNSQMPNGYGLTGNSSAGQCAIILPYPCNSNKYIIFHVTEYSAPGYLSYTIVDMNLNSGLGDIVTSQKNVSLGTGWTEKLCAYYNSTGNFYWVFSHKWNSNQFVGFKVDASGIATQSVTTAIGSVLNCGSYGSTHDAMGQLTISPDGSRIVNALTCQDKFEVFDLNINSGVLSNSIVIPGAGNAWGTAFSPDSRKLYVDGLFGQSVYQYDLSSGNQTTIANSQFNVYTVNGGTFGYMEMGPDSLVYIAKPGSASLTVIYNPNAVGASCNFSLAGPSLGSQTSSHGLSRIAYNTSSLSATGNPPVIVTNLSPTGITCLGQSTTLNASGATTYTWNNGFVGQSQVVTPTVTTTYSVTGETNGCSAMAAITVSVSDCTGFIHLNGNDNSTVVYPNPATNNITIKNDNGSSLVHYEIINSTGKVVQSGAFIEQQDIHISQFTAGIYFIRIKENSKILKFVKD